MNPAPLVVVADDDPDILNLLAMRLRKRGYEVITASDGEAALRLITERVPAAAVLDWVMPVLSGAEVCARVKGEAVTSGVRVILLTARAAQTDIESGFEKGADEYLTKPFDITELDEALQRLLQD